MRFAHRRSLMLVACAAMGRHRPHHPLPKASRLAVIGCLLLVGGNFGLALAEQWVPTGFAALIVAVTPIWFLLLDLRLSRRPSIAARLVRRSSGKSRSRGSVLASV